MQDWADIKDIGEMENFGPLRILEFKKHLISLGKKPSTINQIMSALRKVCNVLNEFGFLEKNNKSGDVLGKFLKILPFIEYILRSFSKN